jgi:hypothetical protein
MGPNSMSVFTERVDNFLFTMMKTGATSSINNQQMFQQLESSPPNNQHQQLEKTKSAISEILNHQLSGRPLGPTHPNRAIF